MTTATRAIGTNPSSSATELARVEGVQPLRRRDPRRHLRGRPWAAPPRPRAAAADVAAGRSPRSRRSRPTSAAPGRRPGPGTTPAAHPGSRCARSPLHPAKRVGLWHRAGLASGSCGSSSRGAREPSGAPWSRALVAAGHEVTVFSRSEERVAALGLPGVVPAVGDAFDPDGVARAVQAAKPEVVLNQLTSLPQSANPLAIKRGFDTTSRLRREVSGTLGRRRPRRGCTPCRRPEHLFRLPARPRDAHRVRPALDRCPGSDRQPHRIARRPSSRPPSATTPSRVSCCATAPSTAPAPTSHPVASTPP